VMQFRIYDCKKNLFVDILMYHYMMISGII
jgi:hypothetical protein